MWETTLGFLRFSRRHVIGQDISFVSLLVEFGIGHDPTRQSLRISFPGMP